jgi:hypothetical protein
MIMKYAFLLGSNAFIVPHGTINQQINDKIIPFLTIRSIYRDKQEGSALVINAAFKDMDGRDIVIKDNVAENAYDLTIKAERDMVHLLRPDGGILFDVHQMDDESVMRLEHYIVAELEVNEPVVVIRVRGEFMLNDNLEIKSENEKLFLNDDVYGTSARAGQGDLIFTTDGVVL